MAIKSKITIKFNAELPVGAVIAFDKLSEFGDGSPDVLVTFLYNVVVNRTSFGQVTAASGSSSVVGENTAINFVNALVVDYNTFVYDISRVGNEVYIKYDSSLNPLEMVTTWLNSSITSHSSIEYFFNNSYDDSTTPPVVTETLIFQTIDYKDISIEIIDTYTNAMPLVIESTQVEFPELKFDGGDTLYQAFRNSSLKFNLLVADKADAKFLHLFTGDEKRYLVKVNMIDADDNSELLWQGFLLPDIYSEPYTNGAFFVPFEAIDMLSVLKNYTLNPWFFDDRYPLPKLLAYLLEATGLNQPMVIAPAIVPEIATSIAMINVPIAQYADKNKYDDNAKILEDILDSLGLQLYSFRGYWFIVGINRLHEPIVSMCEVFDVNGDFVEYARIERGIETFFSEDSVNLSALPTLKKVEFELDVANRLNVFSDSIVNPEFFSSDYISYFGMVDWKVGSTEVYITRMVDQWQKAGTSNYQRFLLTPAQFVYYIPTSVKTSHNMNEAAALANYFYPAGFYNVLEGFKYKLSLEIKVQFESASMPSSTDYSVYDKVVPFQFMVNGVEVYAKRPGINVVNQKKYTHSFTASTTPGYGFDITFKLEDEIYFRNSGLLEVRMNLPIWNNSTGVIPMFILVEKLELIEQEKNDYLEFVSASRPVNNTITLDKPLAFVSSSNTAVQNNFGIGYPSNNNYDKTITSLASGTDYIGQHEFSEGNPMIGVIKEITLKTTDVLKTEVEALFKRGKAKVMFIKNSISGDEKAFPSIYGWLNEVPGFEESKIGYLYDFEKGVILPDGYKLNQDYLIAWDFKYRDVEYDYEIFSNRDKWLVNGDATVDTFLRQLARVYLGCYSKTLMKFEGTQFNLMQPDALLEMYYNDEDRYFIPTSIVMKLTSGKTNISSAIEGVYEDLTNITFE